MGATEEFTDDFLEHYGVKGMRWGVRREDPSGGLVVSNNLHPHVKESATQIAGLMEDRYGFKTKEIVSMGPENPEFHAGTIAYVEPGGRKSTGRIIVRQGDFRDGLKESEKMGWFAEGTGNVKGLLTHESAHAVFHSAKNHGGHDKAFNTAMIAAINQSVRDGIPQENFLSSISGYADASRNAIEAESEMFSQYHWRENPPNFVKVWGETLHAEMGIDPTPFRKVT